MEINKFTFRKNILSKFVAVVIISGSISLVGNIGKINAQSNSKMSDKVNFKIAKINQCDYLNVRSGPSVKNSIVAKTYTNDVVEVLEYSNGWSKVELGNRTIGWVNSNYITLQEKQNNSDIQKVVDLSKKQIGKPYVWGASGPNAFDCSGLIYYSYKNGGNKTLPRTSKEQSKVGVKVEKSNLQPGDLVFFNTSGAGISHVGMYIGNDEFIHSTQPGDTVKVHKINSAYYNRTFVTARRVMG